jgi:histone deacetylase 6
VPIIKQFKPEFIIISCGFDSALNDPLGGLGLTTHGYSYLTLRLKELALKNRVLVVLEGGYNLESLKWASESVVRTLIGEDFPLKMS